VRIHHRHVEFVVGDGAQAAPIQLQAPAAVPSASAAAPVVPETTDSNYSVGQRCQEVFDRLVARVSSSGTSPAAAREVLAMVTQLETDTTTTLDKGTLECVAFHPSAQFATVMRPPQPGPGSSARGQGAYG
jgi:hypothetical protein